MNVPIRIREVCKIIKKTKIRKASGPDGLPTYYVLRIKFYNLNNKQWIFILQNRKIPDTWKEANTVFICKESQGLTLTRNYQPVSFLNHDYKLFKMILDEWLKIIL